MNQLSSEIWKPIPGYEGLYSVSNFGRVKSHERIDKNKHLVKERILHTPINQDGYFQVGLSKDGKPKTQRVHSLVLLTFKGKSNLECNHKNCNKLDNHSENLEYVTKKQNVYHSALNGLQKNTQLANVRRRIPIKAISNSDGSTRFFESISEAGKFLNRYRNDANIRKCLKDKINSAYGYVWRVV
ncbi:MAG: NUMOD4 domain-containing protein [Candidatus Humimicrobiaceae bacterium]